MPTADQRGSFALAAVVIATVAGAYLLYTQLRRGKTSSHKLECRCGAVEIDLCIGAGEASVGVCHCNDCRAYAQWVEGQSDSTNAVLDDNQAVRMVNLYKDAVTVVKGADNIQFRRLTADAPLLRMYAECCHTPLGLVPRLAAVPMVVVYADNIAPNDNLKPTHQFFYAQRATTKDRAALEAAYGAKAYKALPPFFMARIMGRMSKGLLMRRNRCQGIALPPRSDLDHVAPVLALTH